MRGSIKGGLCGYGGVLTVGVADKVNLLEGQALGCGGATAELDDVRHGLEGGEALGGGGGGLVLGDAQLAGILVLELDFEVADDLWKGMLADG